MPAFARKMIFGAANVGVYHCVARCVRQASCHCLTDAASDIDFRHSLAGACQAVRAANRPLALLEECREFLL